MSISACGTVFCDVGGMTFSKCGKDPFPEMANLYRRRRGRLCGGKGRSRGEKEKSPNCEDAIWRPLWALQDGLEPTTPWLTVRCSNQLSYWSISANPLFDCECKSTTFFLFHQTFWGKFFISCKNTVIFSLCCCFLLIIYYFCPKKKELLWS